MLTYETSPALADSLVAKVLEEDTARSERELLNMVGLDVKGGC